MERNSQQLMIFWCPTNKKFILPSHSMKTACTLTFERIKTMTLIWDRRTWLWNWNLEKVVVTKITTPHKIKKSTKKAKAHKEATAKEEQEDPIPLVTHEKNTLHSIFSYVEVYINNQQVYNSNGVYVHKSFISNNFREAISEVKGDLHCEKHDQEEFPDELMETPSSEHFFTRKMKILKGPDGFMFYGKPSVDFFSTSQLLYPFMKPGYD